MISLFFPLGFIFIVFGSVALAVSIAIMDKKFITLYSVMSLAGIVMLIMNLVTRE